MGNTQRPEQCSPQLAKGLLYNTHLIFTCIKLGTLPTLPLKSSWHMYEADVIVQAKKLKLREEYLLYCYFLTEQPLSRTLPVVTTGGAGTGTT